MNKEISNKKLFGIIERFKAFLKEYKEYKNYHP
jgi:hypothetical protein